MLLLELFSGFADDVCCARKGIFQQVVAAICHQVDANVKDVGFDFGFADDEAPAAGEGESSRITVQRRERAEPALRCREVQLPVHVQEELIM